MASFTIANVTNYSVTISVSGLTNGDEVRIFIRLADDADDITEDAITIYNGGSLRHTCNDLEAETDYKVNVCVNGTWLGAQDFTTEALVGERPDDWEWTSTIESGAEIKITAREWNNFTSRINEFRIYDGLEEYDFTTVYRGDDISASIMNEARTAIREIDESGYVPKKVYSGDTIYASFFIDLADALNIIP